MIRTDDHLRQTREALSLMEDALLALTREVSPSKKPILFALMAEPRLDVIRELRREIEDYIGFTAAVAQQSQPEIARALDGTFPGSAVTPEEWPSPASHSLPATETRR